MVVQAAMDIERYQSKSFTGIPFVLSSLWASTVARKYELIAAAGEDRQSSVMVSSARFGPRHGAPVWPWCPGSPGPAFSDGRSGGATDATGAPHVALEQQVAFGFR
jgi:hypothetical protein